MLLINPPLVIPSEAPAGLAKLKGAFEAHAAECQLWDANIEGLQFLMATAEAGSDNWSRRAVRNREANLARLRQPAGYAKGYQLMVSDLNRLLKLAAAQHNLTLADYRDARFSPVRSGDLLAAAREWRTNPFAAFFAPRLTGLVEEHNPAVIGFSVNYLSQALCAFAMAGFVKERWPQVRLVMGGGLITSWSTRAGFVSPFGGLIDELVSGPGEAPLLRMHGTEASARHYRPSLSGLPLEEYLAPGLILPYSASRGCYWSRCAFCPERAEGQAYKACPVSAVTDDLAYLVTRHRPRLIHFTDNALSPRLLRQLAANPPGAPWYGFVRVSAELADPDFCRVLKAAGCVMLKLGLESGDQTVLDRLEKGIELEMVASVLESLHAAGIGIYAYLLFGTPAEDADSARRTLDFTARHAAQIDFLNLAIFNLPLNAPDAQTLERSSFYEGDLSLYQDFAHPAGWGRRQVRQFLEQEFKRHPAIAPIIANDPPLFGSNHAAFFCRG